jgi:hypothetical protein
MLFHTVEFLGFFAIVFPVYWLLPWHRVRMSWLLAASFFFSFGRVLPRNGLAIANLAP